MNSKKEFVNSSFYLNDQFKSNVPFGCGKIGNCELMCIYNYYMYKQNNQPVQWMPSVVDEIYNNAGVFPQTEQARVEFIKEITNCLPHIDSLAWWSMFNMPFEASYIKSYSPNCELIDLQSIEPFYSGSPWSEFLENKNVMPIGFIPTATMDSGLATKSLPPEPQDADIVGVIPIGMKNVLVISPFTDSIKLQHEKRDLIWKDKRVLPTFKNLLTLKHPHSPGIDKPSKYSSWIDMIRHYKMLMDSINYDVMLIGAGASSLPLVAHAKRQGKKAIHLGGPLQLLFGIKGGRWNNGDIGKHFYNEHWVNPSVEETPEKYKSIEGGCYW